MCWRPISSGPGRRPLGDAPDQAAWGQEAGAPGGDAVGCSACRRRWMRAMVIAGMRVSAAMPVPTTAGPVAARLELRVAPAIPEPTAVPRLYAETDIATPSVEATPAKRAASEESTGLALRPTRPSRTTSSTVGT